MISSSPPEHVVTMTESNLERALSAFTARSSRRDAEIDRERFAALTRSVVEQIDAIGAERLGIIQRVKRTLDDPAPVAPSWVLGRQPRLSKTEFEILERRLQVLDRYVLELRKIVAALSGLDAMVPL